MAGLGKGLAIIELFASGTTRLTVAAAADGTGVARATARRCLLTLTELGYLLHHGKYFTPTPRMLRLGDAYLDTAELPRLAQSHLADVRDELGESVSLAVWEDGGSVFVARAEATRIVSTGVRVGALLPAHCSATGKVLLAAQPEETIAAVLASGGRERRTDRTIVDRSALVSAIETARREGFATNNEELELGMRAVAVPVHDPAGRVVAAMSVSTATVRRTIGELREVFVPTLRAAASRLGHGL